MMKATRGRVRTPKACAKCNGRHNRFRTECFGVRCVLASLFRSGLAFGNYGGRSSPLQLLMHSKCFDKLPIEFDACFLHFAIRQQPYERFIVKIDHLNAISPWITKVTAKRRLQFEFVFLSKFLSYFLELLFIANHDPEMPHVSLLKFVDFENGEELMVAQFEERVTLPTTHLFEIENILVKSHRLLNVIHLDR